MTDGIHVQMRHLTMASSEPISVLIFLATFKLACDSNGISEEAAVWRHNQYVKNWAAPTIKTRKQLRNESCKTFGRARKSCRDIVRYLLSKYAPNGVISGTVNNATRCKRSVQVSASEFSIILCDMLLICGGVYEEAAPKENPFRGYAGNYLTVDEDITAFQQKSHIG